MISLTPFLAAFCSFGNPLLRLVQDLRSAYFLVSLPADTCKPQASSSTNPTTAEPALSSPFAAHRHWEAGQTWKSALNNLRLLLKPYCCWGWLKPWLDVFPIPGLKRGFSRLMDCMNRFQIVSIPETKAA